MTPNKKLSKVASVIIPAYNEEVNLQRLLYQLTASRAVNQLQIIVACNGCTDKTVQVAQKYAPSVDYLDIKEPSKINAINSAERISEYYPRIYLDADVSITSDNLVRFASDFTESRCLVGGLSIRVDTTNCPYLVKRFYSVWLELPYLNPKNKSVGSGFFAISEQGRSRFSEFPDVIADDGFVNFTYTKNEKFRHPSIVLGINAPRTVKDLIKIKSRAYAGGRQLRAFVRPKYTQQSQGKAYSIFKFAWKKPQRIPDLSVYVLIRFLSVLHSILFRRLVMNSWMRDESNR